MTTQRKESGRLIQLSPADIKAAQQAALRDFHEQQQRFAQERAESEAAGVPALERLVRVARGGSGQCHYIRRFLLGLFNGHRWPFDMTGLRCLDAELQADCLAVLRMDMNPRCEVHERIANGIAIFLEFWEIEKEADQESADFEAEA